MNDRKIKNVAASVRQRLLNFAQAAGRPFQEVLQYFAMERFLYRLSQSPHADKFELKGALMLTVWGASTIRPTKDIDLLGHMSNSVEALTDVVRDVCRQDVEPDGLAFDANSVAGRLIKEDADYEGVRINFRGALQNVPLPMQIDVGFGDTVFPRSEMIEYPTILDHGRPRLRGYSRETAVAEKFEAMVKLGLLNSRMKDFFDIWLLARQFDFDGQTLTSAIQRTFANRGTAVTANPTAFTDAFANDATKQSQWQAFLRKSHLTFAPASLPQVVDFVASFLRPVAVALEGNIPFNHRWQAPGPWVTKQA